MDQEIRWVSAGGESDGKKDTSLYRDTSVCLLVSETLRCCQRSGFARAQRLAEDLPLENQKALLILY